MKLPFFLSDKDWQDLKPRQIDELGRRTDLPPEQERFLSVFRIVDLRVEWACSKVVVIFNVVLLLGIVSGLTLLGFTGPQILTMMINFAKGR